MHSHLKVRPITDLWGGGCHPERRSAAGGQSPQWMVIVVVWVNSWRCRSEVAGEFPRDLIGLVDAFGAIGGRDVAEAAFVEAGRWLGRVRCGESADGRAELVDELTGQGAPGHAGNARWIDDLAGQPGVAEALWKRFGQGVLVDLELNGVPGLLLAGLDVDDEGVFAAVDDQVGSA